MLLSHLFRQPLQRLSLLRLLGFLVFAALLPPLSSVYAQVGTTEVVSLTLSSSQIASGSYLTPFGSGNGVYIVAPNGTPPANNIAYYPWPGGVAENINANIQAVVDGTAPLGAGSWQVLTRPANDGKVEILFHPHEIFGNGTYTLSDINSIVWHTDKPDPQTSPDWYISI